MVFVLSGQQNHRRAKAFGKYFAQQIESGAFAQAIIN
jgi:hypothetical protein